MTDLGARGASGVVYRVHWTPGSDRLVGRCHCGAEREGEDPVSIWAWLLAHPDHPEDAAE